MVMTNWRFYMPKKKGYLEDLLQPGLVYLEKEDTRWDIGEKEIKVFADLLRELLRFEGRQRATSDFVLEHEWFGLGL
jgi:hypothetical protein